MDKKLGWDESEVGGPVVPADKVAADVVCAADGELGLCVVDGEKPEPCEALRGDEGVVDGDEAPDRELDICVIEGEKPELCGLDPESAAELEPSVTDGAPAVVVTALALLETSFLSDVTPAGEIVVSALLEVEVPAPDTVERLEVYPYPIPLSGDDEYPAPVVDTIMEFCDPEVDTIEDCDEDATLETA